MQRFILLTQNNCPNCERLKLMLAKPLKGKYDAVIKPLHREHDEDEFYEAVRRYAVHTTPALINVETNEVCRSLSLGEVKNFLTQQ